MTPTETANASVIEKFSAPPVSRPPERRRRPSADRVGDDAGTGTPRRAGSNCRLAQLVTLKNCPLGVMFLR
ncbi:hypothetical protein [Streptomyces sp. NBC_01716]|uniref:hypothetical protein n=1 Tax=Streptomyces sp. NBC_01716 TaxID=2975917 RepID=UPI002E35CAB0|nr:hypothetical protein [Streptomyces sp. NBC_01716]